MNRRHGGTRLLNNPNSQKINRIRVVDKSLIHYGYFQETFGNSGYVKFKNNNNRVDPSSKQTILVYEVNFGEKTKRNFHRKMVGPSQRLKTFMFISYMLI